MLEGADKQLIHQLQKATEDQDSRPIPTLMTGALEALADLSRDLAAMSRAVTTRENELRKLLDLMQTVEHGVMPEDVLGNIFESFSGVIPFERIGCAFLAEDGKRVVADWAKSELGPVSDTEGLFAAAGGKQPGEPFSPPGSRGSSTIWRRIWPENHNRTRRAELSRRAGDPA